MSSETNLSEAEIRALRDKIYGPSTDAGWDACKENWMREDSIIWLKNEARKLGGTP